MKWGPIKPTYQVRIECYWLERARIMMDIVPWFKDILARVVHSDKHMTTSISANGVAKDTSEGSSLCTIFFSVHDDVVELMATRLHRSSVIHKWFIFSERGEKIRSHNEERGNL